MKVVKKIDDSDFEFYTIRLPLLLRKSKRSSYLSKELEKNHPCFSDRCWWKSRVKYTGKGFVASIAVMDKLKLARYKEENPGKILKFEEKNNRIFFIEKEMILAVLLFLFFIAFTSFFIYLGVYRNRQMNKDEKGIISANENINKKNESVSEDCRKVIESISLYNGKIISFGINTCSLNMSLCKCYPEDIRVKDLNSSELVFNNGIPYFNIQKSFIEERTQSFERKESDEIAENEFHVNARNLLLKNKANIISENTSENTFEFEISDLSAVLSETESLIFNSNHYLSELNIDYENKIYLIKIKFTNEQTDLDKIISSLTENINVFEKSNINTMSEDLRQKEKVWERIGTITDKNEKYEFYKDSEGKIRSVKK